MPATDRMVICECHGISFDSILRYARQHGVRDVDRLTELVDFGQTCTACHCDLKAYLREELPRAEGSEEGSHEGSEVGSEVGSETGDEAGSRSGRRSNRVAA